MAFEIHFNISFVLVHVNVLPLVFYFMISFNSAQEPQGKTNVNVIIMKTYCVILGSPTESEVMSYNNSLPNPVHLTLAGTGVGGLVGGRLFKVMGGWWAFLSVGVFDGIYGLVFLSVHVLISRQYPRHAPYGQYRTLILLLSFIFFS